MEFIKELFKDTSNYIEVREFGRIKEDSRQHYFTKESIKAYNPPFNKNIYFGVFDRKSKANGKAINCNSTRALWCDYDNGMEGLEVSERIEEVERRILKAKLPKPSILVSSGNGIHSYWLLKERASNGIVGLNKAIASATNGDTRATDKARILRLPNTRNVKDIDKPLKCEVVKANYGLKYDLRELEEALKEYIPKEKKRPLKVDTRLTSTLLDSVKPDRGCISAILKGVPEGERNFALGRLTKWLQVKGYTKARAKNIIIEWNKRNNPPEKEDKLISNYYQYWKGEYKLLGCLQSNPQLQQVLNKYCNRPECKFTMAIGRMKLDNMVEYNNRLLSDLYKISGNDLIIYGLLVRHKEGLSTSLLTEKLTSRALGKPCISRPTMLKGLDTLRKKGFIEVVEGIQRRGIDNLYKAIPQGNFGLGYTLLSNGAINGAIDKRVTSGELKLYVLLLKYAFSKGSCYPSLDTLAKELRTSKSYISNTLSELEKVDYIKRTYKLFNGVEKLDISLLV